jgi:hypothetical protein
MRHLVLDASDIPGPAAPIDRRRTADRRTVWRGGRRDSDWVNRPPDAWQNLERRRKLRALRRVFAVLHLW